MGNCYTEGITYEIKCEGGGCTQRNIYKGESGNNAFTRGKKHLSDLSNKSKTSTLWRHCQEIHRGQVQRFSMKITATFRNDAMLRQITEAVQIDRTTKENLMNTRAEWNRTRVPRTIITDE